MSTTSPTDQAQSFGLAVWGTVTHAVLSLGLLGLYVFYVATAKKTFDEYGLMLPYLSQFVVRLSSLVTSYWWALVPMMLVAGVADFWAIAGLSAYNRFLAAVWLTGVVFVLLVVAGLTIFAIEHPIQLLKEGLAR